MRVLNKHLERSRSLGLLQSGLVNQRNTNAIICTVVDNIQYGPQLRGKKLSDSEVHKMLKLADLETLANEPEVLLLDEPTSALDPISTPNIEDVLVKLKTNQEMTIIMVSHSIKQIQRVVDVKWNGLHWSIISFTARVVLKHVIGFYDLNVS
nr:PREDICTED: ABC transporter I family member 17-like [Daucus carota subsp. sativus]